MRSFTIALIACCLFAGAIAEVAFTSEQTTCLSSLTFDCTGSTCSADLQTFADCTKSKCATASDLSAYGACVTDDCSSSNAAVQTYAEATRHCVYSSVIGLSAILFAVLASLF